MDDLVSQAKDRSETFDNVIYHSNSQESSNGTISVRRGWFRKHHLRPNIRRSIHTQ